MRELTIDLDFTCCLCQNPLGVTLQCGGKGMYQGGIASVAIPCPSCGDMNEIYFTPLDGSLHGVRPARKFKLIPEPSLN